MDRTEMISIVKENIRIPLVTTMASGWRNGLEGVFSGVIAGVLYLASCVIYQLIKRTVKNKKNSDQK